MNDGLEIMWNEVSVTYSKVLTKHTPEAMINLSQGMRSPG